MRIFYLNDFIIYKSSDTDPESQLYERLRQRHANQGIPVLQSEVKDSPGILVKLLLPKKR